MDEARLSETEAGRRPAGEGWFVLNVGDAAWLTDETFGAATTFESPESRFEELGINIQILQPGQPNGLYHAESNQEDFLVLAGECLLIVEEQERLLHAWDFVHCPPGTRHIFVGAGDGPCLVLMVGTRTPDDTIVYPVSAVALRHHAGVERETTDAHEAYASYGEARLGRPDGWDELPWAM
jgi:uncharacterized cupin superfamily protein